MEKNIQIHEMLPGNLYAGNLWQKEMVENTILRRDEIRLFLPIKAGLSAGAASPG